MKQPFSLSDLKVTTDLVPLTLTYIELQLLNQNPKRTRRHTTAKIRKLAKFISVSRVICPILVDKNNTIIAGHARVEAAKILDLTTIPAIEIEHLDETMLRAFALADNQFALDAGWDKKAVREELIFLSNVILDYGLEITDIGFSTAEIDIRIGDEALIGPEDEVIPPDTHAPAVTKSGDTWILGKHRLICGDSRDRLVYEHLMQDETAGLIFTDPPYNVPINGHVCGSGSIKHEEFAMASGEMSAEQFIAFLAAFICANRLDF